MQDAWRAYLELAFGLTEASKKRAKKVAKELVGKGGATAAQLQSFAEDLVSTSRDNRETLARLVRSEVDRALGAVGLATAEDMAQLNSRIQELEQQVRSAPSPASAATAPKATTTTTVPRRTTAKKAVAKKTAAKSTAAKKTVAKKTVAKKTVAKARAE